MKIPLLLGSSLVAFICLISRSSAGASNDLFANRTILSGTNITTAGSNASAGTENGEDTGGGAVVWDYSVWYEWTAPTNGVVHLSGSTTTPNFYLSIRAYRGAAVNALTLAATTPDGGIPVSPGDTLAIQVASIYYPIWSGGGGRGPFTLTLVLETPAPTSSNDAFSNRVNITTADYLFEGSIYGATNEPGEPLPAPTLGRTLWWKITPAEACVLTLTPAAGQFSPVVRVYQGGQLASLNLRSPLSGTTYQLALGQEYAIQMAGAEVGAGRVTLNARVYSISNNMFSGSLKFEGTNVTVHGDTIAATFEPNEPYPGINPNVPDYSYSNTIWFSWEAPVSGRVWFSHGPVWWRAMAVYTGPTVDHLARVRLVANDNGVFCFLAQQGTVYHFQYAGQSGDFALELQSEADPPTGNDNFAAAQVLKGPIGQDRRSVLGATLEVGEPAHLGPVGGKSIWWKWESPMPGSVTFFAERSLATNVLLAVYRGKAVESLALAAVKYYTQTTLSVPGGETYYLAAALPGGAVGDVLLYWQYNSTSTTSRNVPGNLLREPSWEGTGVLGALYWGMAGEIGGFVNEGGGADGKTWPVLGGGAQIWQDFTTVPGQHHALRFAFAGGGAQVRVSWDERELGVATIPANEDGYWHWADFTAYASNTTSRLRFQNLGAMFANVPMDAFSVVPLTAPPQILNEPSSASVMAGGTAALIVGVSGSPPLTYQWLHNNSPLPVLTNSLLLLEAVTTNQAGTYQVIASSPFGAATSAPVTLVVNAPTKPVVTWQPYGDTVAAGGYYNFSVVAAGTAPLIYQWFQDGAEIAGATNRNLTFNTVVVSNAGTYSVRVTNHAGIVWSLGAKLVVTNAVDGGGKLRLDNESFSFAGTEVDAPIFDIDGVTPLNGSNYLAQLYAGPTLGLLRPVGQPSPFRSGFRAGYVYAQVVTLPTVPPGSNAIAQVRAWETGKGSSYEEARAMGGKFGKSELLTVVVGGGLLPPTGLEGLQSFNLGAGMPQFANGEIHFVEQQPGDVLVWSHRGEPGFRYLIEKSWLGFEWRPFVVITNTSPTVTFTDFAQGESGVVFYRSRILD